jgi:hypothetical protein
MERPRFDIVIASGRDVASRWKAQYCRDGKWAHTIVWSAKVTYDRLVALGATPSPEAVSEVVPQGWAYPLCNVCGDYCSRAVSFGDCYTVEVCERCLEASLFALRGKKPDAIPD